LTCDGEVVRLANSKYRCQVSGKRNKKAEPCSLHPEFIAYGVDDYGREKEGRGF
jgi:hypothetical protein